MTAQRLEKRQQQVEELCAAVLRALAASPRLRYRGNRLELAGRAFPIRAPHLHPEFARDDFRSFRGVADSLALRLRHSDRALHRSRMPASPIERLVFDLLEQLRCEALVSEQLPGVRHNLMHRFSQWAEQFIDSGQLENHLGLMLFTLALMSWRLLCNGHTPERIQDLLEAPRMGLLGQFGAEFGLLRKTRHDQAAFATHALNIAFCIAALIDQLEQQLGSADERRDTASEKSLAAFALLLENDGGEDGDGGGIAGANDRAGAQDGFRYRVFSRDHDVEQVVGKRVRAELLLELRQRLDQRILRQGLNLQRLARQLSALLAAPRLQGWEFAQEEGRLDGGRLSRLVTNPNQRDLFRREPLRPHSECVVTFLIDNSGSMRTHIESLALLVDCLSRALELAGAKTEILGFTTGQWNGGRPFKRWRGQGSPADPGRLNELCHMIYKDADTPWRRARPAIAGLLKSDLFREGVDGEALLWARQRLRQRNEPRRLLIVISDGCPMDSATHQANREDILDLHLRQVARQIEDEGEIELYALGVGLDLSAYYRHSLELDLQQGVENALFGEVLGLLGRGRARR
ncbi:cobalamin biosynthesis protein CobT [Pseudomonas kuykendallii]|uniref:Cobaltochelatase CobT n=1 Tax=Pseudomonas kuykendallii TaxID=1007099 RepID=A0A1H2V9Q7_9PSED|nr:MULTISPECIES: cobalamin biosynthesis protein CobT [Pseudomonas]MCQ4271261.1 cobalamin biosynthesis protein CobT [Pseudomonas kuykendallii]SDW65052.1 cobaltochelatase CobT [Pseudomonas kuykendallii]